MLHIILYVIGLFHLIINSIKDKKRKNVTRRIRYALSIGAFQS